MGSGDGQEEEEKEETERRLTSFLALASLTILSSIVPRLDRHQHMSSDTEICRKDIQTKRKNR